MLRYIILAAQITGFLCWISSAVIIGYTVFKTYKSKRKTRKQVKKNYEWVESMLINEGGVF
jgi:membrane protein DedA with SNARE-associated domain